MTHRKLGISFALLLVLLAANGCGGNGLVDLESRPVQAVAVNTTVTVGDSAGSPGAVRFAIGKTEKCPTR